MIKGQLKYTPVMPAWFEHLADDSLLSVPDLVTLFGYKNVSSLHASVVAGNFPPPDDANHDLSRVSKSDHFANGGPRTFKLKDRKMYWRARTIRNEIARRRELETKPKCRVRTVVYK